MNDPRHIDAPATILWRACCRIEPDRKTQSAATVVVLYLVAVVVLGALLATLARAATTF